MRNIASAQIGPLDPLIYGYSNARVKASRSLLVKSSQIAELIDVRTMPAVLELLERTPYKQDLVAIGAKGATVEQIELALGRHFARIAQKIRRITPKHDRPLVDAFLYRWDAHNLRVILLSKKVGKDQSHLFVPAGSVSEKRLAELSGSHDMSAFMGRLHSTPFGSAFFSSKPGRALLGKKLSFENAQDAISAFELFYFENLEKSALKAARDSAFILSLNRAEIDAKNISTLLRLRKAGMNHEEALGYSVKGGTLKPSQLRHLSKLESVQEVEKYISRKFPLKQGSGAKGIGALETELERHLALAGIRTLRRSMLSVGAIIGFLFLKEEEMNNIRKAVRAKALGLSKEQAMEMLVEV
jgi:V/A-type H+-transporting ATPase subunit C